jgi:hypothetical protein
VVPGKGVDDCPENPPHMINCTPGGHREAKQLRTKIAENRVKKETSPILNIALSEEVLFVPV